MNILTKVIDGMGGSLVGGLVDTVKEYFPPSMSDTEKAKLELAMANAAHSRELELTGMMNVAEKEFNDRVKAMEGTANDLLALPVVGRLLIFARGAQRPVWGFSALFLDYQVFSGAWTIPQGSQQESAFFAINLLVLGFLFGERAIKNLTPLLEKWFKK